MSDIKFCPSCGMSLSISAVFCHKCGQKQIVSDDQPEIAIEKQESENSGQTSQEEIKKAEETVPSHFEINDEDRTPDAAEDTQPQAEITSETKTEFIKQEDDNPFKTVQSDAVSPITTDPASPVHAGQPYTAPPVSQNPPFNSPPPAAPPQNQNMYQPMFYPQNQVPQQNVQTPPKKKFPWFFTVLWSIMFLAVVGWGVYFYLLMSNDFDYPKFSEDAQRIVLFAASAAILIYTFSLKLAMKKFKVFPTIILILSAVVVFYFFCMVELKDGDMLHDVISNLTESIIPTSGE